MATLKSLVDETTNIKDDLIACCNNLKDILESRGVECSEFDKLSTLVDKIPNIRNKTLSGTDFLSDSVSNSYDSAGIGEKYVALHRVNCNKVWGDLDINISYKMSYGAYCVLLKHYRNSVCVYDFESPIITAGTLFEKTITLNVCDGDVVEVGFRGSHASSNARGNGFVSYSYSLLNKEVDVEIETV